VIDEFIPAVDCTAGEAAGNWMAEEGATQQRAAKYRTDGTCLICLKEL
jgi:hypothetical protein